MKGRQALKELFESNPIVFEEMNLNHLFVIIDKELRLLEIIKNHKLLNYVIKNEKCASMYQLNESQIKLIKEWLDD